MQFNLARCVIDGNCGLILLGLLDVIGVDQIAENLYRIGSAEANGRSGEPDAPGVRQGFGKIPCKSRFKAVLGPMGFVCNHNNVGPFRQDRMFEFRNISLGIGFQPELFNGGENDLAALCSQQVAQIVHIVGMLDVAHQAAGRNELIMKLIVQVIAIHLNYKSGIF